MTSGEALLFIWDDIAPLVYFITVVWCVMQGARMFNGGKQ